eukprot:PITA_36260
MDFITRLPSVHGKDCIYVVVDRLTKYAHFFAIPTQYTTSQVTKLFFREVFHLHELPKTIVKDRDSRFMGAFWQDLFRLVGTELTPSTSYHPQTDGQTERVNKSLEGYLQNYVTGQQRAWIRWLHLGEAPKAKYWIQESQDILKALKDNLLTAQNQQKMYVDRHRVERQFEEGDLVYLRLQPYRQSTLKQKGAKKLQPRFYGSYRVIFKVEKVAFELELLPGSKIHNVFHVSCLKKVLGLQVTTTVELP